MLKSGPTKSEHIIFFFELLHLKLCDWFGEEYINSTIVVFDNASVHVSERCKAYLKWKKLSVLTLPSYTPEQNNVEQVFKRLKKDLSKCDMSKKRLEYIYCHRNDHEYEIIIFKLQYALRKCYFTLKCYKIYHNHHKIFEIFCFI